MKHFPRIFSILLIVLGTSLIVFGATEYSTRMKTLGRVADFLQSEQQHDAWAIVVRIDLQKSPSWVFAMAPFLVTGGLIIIAGLLAPFAKKGTANVAELGASPNGGPVTPVGTSSGMKGPPSVSSTLGP